MQGKVGERQRSLASFCELGGGEPLSPPPAGSAFLFLEQFFDDFGLIGRTILLAQGNSGLYFGRFDCPKFWVHSITRGSPGITPVACKASAGAVEHLDIARVGSIVAFINDLAGSGRWAAGADADAGTDYRELDWDPSAVIVLGAEGAGLRPRVREVCDRLVRLPMRGSVGSLNLSTAAAVLAFQAVAGD